jgi:death on curing protein
VSEDVWVPTLEDYLDAASFLLETSSEALRRLPRIHLAESALHAPFAAFGGEPAYPTLLRRAAVLIVHLAQNHPLPDGNKRAAFLVTAQYLERNGRRWKPQDVETDAGMVERIAAGTVSDDEVQRWLAVRTSSTGG